MSRARDLLLGVFPALATCTSAAPPPATQPGVPEPPQPETQPDVPTPVQRAGLERPRTHLLVERHNPEAKAAVVLPLALTDAELVPQLVAAAIERPALPHPHWPGHFVSVAAHAGGATWIAGEPDGEGFRLVARTIGDPATRTAALPLIPSALHHVGDVALVGAGNMVGHVDLSQATPTWVETHRRPDMTYKAYDLFARAGTWLIAIDDVVTPIYADSFRLDDAGRPSHTAAWTLPGVINGRYTFAALARTADRDGVLYVVTPYGIMDGHGQDLTALPIRADALKHGPDLVLNATRTTDPPVLEEHVSRQTGKPEKLAAGGEFTAWRGLALHRGRVLLAADARGLLVLPGEFTPDTQAIPVDVGGDCRDVIVDGDRTFVLVGGRSDAVVELAWDGPAARELRRVPLPDPYDRFLH